MKALLDMKKVASPSKFFAFVESNVGFVEFNSTSFSFFIVALSTKVE